MSTWNTIGLGIAAGFAGLGLLSTVRPEDIDYLFGVTHKVEKNGATAAVAVGQVNHRTVATLVGGRDLAIAVSIFVLGRAGKHQEMGVVILSTMCLAIPDVWLAWCNKKYPE